MGVDIGGRHIVMVGITIPTRRHTVARITAVTVIIIQRLTMIPATGAYGWKQTAYGPYGSATRGAAYNPYTGTYARGASVSTPYGIEARHRHITRIPAPMLRPGKVRARMLSGVVPTCREETRALPWVITQQRMERWRAPLIRREEKWPLPARSGGTVRSVKLPAAICMPGTMAMCIRIRVMAGRSTIMEAGTLQVSLSLTGKGQKIASNGLEARVISSDRLQRVAMIERGSECEAAPSVQGEAVSIGLAVEVAPVIWTARLRTGRVATFLASVSKDFKGAALIVSVAAEDLAVIDLVAAVEDLVVIASVAVVDSAAVALGVLGGAVPDFAVADGDEN